MNREQEKAMFASRGGKINWDQIVPKLKQDNVDFVNPRTERKEIVVGLEDKMVPYGGKSKLNEPERFEDIVRWWELQRRIAQRKLGHTANVQSDGKEIVVSRWVDPKKYKSDRIVFVNNRTGKIKQ